PLARSVLRSVIPFGRKAWGEESSLLVSAGGRLFIDLTDVLRLSGPRHLLPQGLTNLDALMADALAEVVQRQEFRKGRRTGLTFLPRLLLGGAASAVLRCVGYLLWRNPERSARRLDRRIHVRADAIEKAVRALPPGPARLQALRDRLGRLFAEDVFPLLPA